MTLGIKIAFAPKLRGFVAERKIALVGDASLLFFVSTILLPVDMHNKPGQKCVCGLSIASRVSLTVY